MGPPIRNAYFGRGSKPCDVEFHPKKKVLPFIIYIVISMRPHVSSVSQEEFLGLKKNSSLDFFKMGPVLYAPPDSDDGQMFGLTSAGASLGFSAAAAPGGEANGMANGEEQGKEEKSPAGVISIFIFFNTVHVVCRDIVDRVVNLSVAPGDETYFFCKLDFFSRRNAPCLRCPSRERFVRCREIFT